MTGVQTCALPIYRPRRMRRDDWSRRLMQENSVSANDLIYPVFLLEGQGKSEAVASMPGVNRVSLDLLFPVAQECVDLGIPVLALFPVIDAALKTPDGKEAFNPNGLIPTAVRELKKRFPNLGIMTDVALDPYTSHGQDGVLDEQGREIGVITSGTFSPTLKVGIALALVDPVFEVGSTVAIDIRGRASKAQLSALPLVPSHVR